MAGSASLSSDASAKPIEAGAGIGVGIERTGIGFVHCIVAMLTKLGQRGYTIHEETDEDSVSRNDTDTDSDPDSDRSRK